PANGIPDGMEHWNTLLGGLQAAGILPATPPRERQILRTVALGTPVWVDGLTYDPGLLGGAATAPLGPATTFILENANPLHPLAPAGAPFTGDEEPASFPDGIDSACDPNPLAFDGTDADGDGYQNRGDNCPLVANGPFQDNQQDLGEFLSGPPVDGGPASDGI